MLKPHEQLALLQNQVDAMEIVHQQRLVALHDKCVELETQQKFLIERILSLDRANA